MGNRSMEVAFVGGEMTKELDCNMDVMREGVACEVENRSLESCQSGAYGCTVLFEMLTSSGC